MQSHADGKVVIKNAASVYTFFSRKVIHARFAVVLCAWKEEYMKKKVFLYARNSRYRAISQGKGRTDHLSTPEAVTPGDEGSKKRRLEWKNMTVPILKDKLEQRKLVLKGKRTI